MNNGYIDKTYNYIDEESKIDDANIHVSQKLVDEENNFDELIY